MLSEGQFKVRDLVMGPGTAYDVGRDTNPFIVSIRADQTAARSWNHGSWSGAEWGDERAVPFRVVVRGEGTSGWLAAHQALMSAFAPIGDAVEDVELRFMLGGSEYLLFGRPRMVEPNVENIVTGKAGTRAAFVATDPLIYSGTLSSTGAVGLPIFVGGLSVPNPANMVVNSGFEVDTSGWFSTGSTLVRSTAEAFRGLASGHVTPDGATATVETGITTSAAPDVVVGNSYRATVKVFFPDGYSTVNVAISWLDSGGSIISADVGATVEAAAGEWTGLVVTATAPASAVAASPRVQVTGTPAATDDYYVDEMRFWPPDVGGLPLPTLVESVRVGGAADMLNEGTAAAGISLRVDGPVSEPRVTVQHPDGSVNTLTFHLDLLSGQWLEVDTAARQVFLNGLPQASRRGQTTAEPDWPLARPGTNSLRFGASDFDTGTVTAEWRSAWW